MRLFSDLDAPLVNPDYAPRVALPIPTASISAAPSVTMTINRLWFSHIIGILDALDQPDAWIGSEYQIESARAQIRELIASAEEETPPVNTLPLGLVIPFAGLTATLPDWLLLCDGATHNRVDYPDLYAVLETAFIVDADNFVTPDLNGRFPLGDDDNIGATGGSETHTLTVNEMPSHSHQRGSANAWILQDGPAPPGSGEGGYVTQPGTGAFFYKKNSTNSAGSGNAHNNMPPFMRLRYYIVAKQA